MSKADQFRQYAEEALLWAAQSKTEEEKRLLLSWCSHGPKRRSRATALWSSAAIRQNPEPRKARPRA
jgi:hypothetical protein